MGSGKQRTKSVGKVSRTSSPSAPEPTLHERLQGSVGVVEPNYRRMAESAIVQRDDALKALNHRANVEKLLIVYDRTLVTLEQTMDRLERLEHRAAVRIQRLGMVLGAEEGEL